MSCGCDEANQPMIGTEVTLPLEFRTRPADGETEGDPADPTSIEIRVLRPDGEVDEYTHLSSEVSGGDPAVGLWEFTWTPAHVGEHWVYVRGTGGGVSATSQRSVTIHDTHVPLGV